MSFNIYKVAGIATIIIIFVVYFNSLIIASQQAKIDKAVVEYVGSKSKADAKQVIHDIKELYDEELFEDADIVCDSDGVSCQLW